MTYWLYEKLHFEETSWATFVDDLLSGLLDLSRGDQALLTRKLAGQLRSLISEGRLEPGQRLPSSRAMARSLGISRNTVSLAIEQLAAEGYLSTGHNRRPVVAPGTSLGTGKPSGHAAPRRGSPKTSLSRWAQHLSDAAWPPVYSGRPQAFQPGLSDEREFPLDIWGRCLRRSASGALRGRARSHNAAGLREALVGHLMVSRGIKARPEQIFIVPSAQAAIALVARIMIDPEDIVWIESPGYGGAYSALRSTGARMVGVPIDADGMKIARGGAVPRLIFVTPSHQYPTGHMMTVARRIELLQFASAVGATIIEDDYDGEFHFDGTPVAALAGLGLSDQTIYLGTFSKAMIADIRVGYLVVPDALTATVNLAQRHLGLLVSVVIQMALADFMAFGHYRSHVRKMTRLYRSRRDRLVDALTRNAGDKLVVDVPAGGMQLLARCDTALDDVGLSSALGRAGVTTRPLSEMLYHKSREAGLFMGFAAWNDSEIDDGACIIGRHLRLAEAARRNGRSRR